jgi:hypothetical protein
MKVIAKVLDVEVKSIKNNTQQLAQVTLKSSGTEAFTAVMFNRDVEDGKARQLEGLLGREIVTDLELDVREGSIDYRFGFGAQFIPLDFFARNFVDRSDSKRPVPGSIQGEKMQSNPVQSKSG